MAISNELSSEIAAALLAHETSPQELRQLKETVLQVHSALQKMSEDARAYRSKAKTMAANRSDSRPN
jgi:hypothetical protein